jgi:hypothetical protein
MYLLPSNFYDAPTANAPFVFHAQRQSSEAGGEMQRKNLPKAPNAISFSMRCACI